MASNVNGQFNMTEVNTDTHISFEPFNDCSESGLIFRLHPVVWNGVEFNCAGEFADVSGLERWGIRWLDIDEVGPKNEIGLLGAIHSLTQPEFDSGRTSFSVDFGSAPLQAFVELLDVLKAMDASDLAISSSATESMH
jgi:hypothetical protein